MTAYPAGKVIDWGPLYPFIAATLCLITGATTRNEIISTAGWVSPLMAAALVPVMFKLGELLWNRITGLVAAGLISFLSFQYFFLTSYGWVDHHGAEVLFISVFFLGYLFALVYARDHPVDSKQAQTFIIPVILSVSAGILYFLALLTSTTVLLALLVIAVFTFIQNILDYFTGHKPGYLLVANLGTLVIPVLLLAIFGFRLEGISLTQYSFGIVYLHLALIAETVLLFLLSMVTRKKPRVYLISFVGLCTGIFILTLIVPVFQSIRSQAEGLLFGFSGYSVAVMETLPWTFSAAVENFNVALILMAGGFIFLFSAVMKKKSPEPVFLLIWSAVMLLVTIQFQRFGYYLTVNVVLLSAICITEPLIWNREWITTSVTSAFSRFSRSRAGPEETKDDKTCSVSPKTKKRIKKSDRFKASGTSKRTDRSVIFKRLSLIAVIVLIIPLCAISLTQEINFGMNTPQREISADWIESLGWLGNNTPPTGIDYDHIYGAQGFAYPPESYGIMAVWDAGHWITVLSHRIPITNPFQDNLGGKAGAAAFFLSENEKKADEILSGFKGKYIITDSGTAVYTFIYLVPWQSNSEDVSSYIKWFLIPDGNDASRLTKIHRYDNAYFQTMVVRLHNFDGSMALPSTADYIRYVVRQVPAPGETADFKGYARVISSESQINASRLNNDTPVFPEGVDVSPGGNYANVFSDLPYRPTQKVPALSHYRLIHESANNASVTLFPESDTMTLPDIKYVKVFEFVKGAHIPGEGIIELPVVTNTGRTFTYRGESSAGEFVVPYSTVGNPCDVRATGPYHIVGTARYIDVTENDVSEGIRVTG